MAYIEVGAYVKYWNVKCETHQIDSCSFLEQKSIT